MKYDYFELFVRTKYREHDEEQSIYVQSHWQLLQENNLRRSMCLLDISK